MVEANRQAIENNDELVKAKTIARRALASCPRYDGKSSYRQFLYRFQNWYKINNIEDVKTRGENRQLIPDIEFHKQTLLYCMEGNAVELVQRIAPRTPRWQECNTFQQYLYAVKEIFMPLAESQLARAEFTARKQGEREYLELPRA